MSTVLVFVIAGVIIAAIAVATLREAPKPATTSPPRRRDPSPRPGAAPQPEASPAATAWEPASYGTGAAPEPALLEPALVEPALWEPARRDAAPVDGEPDVRSRLHRLRSAALLVVTVVVLGSLTAGLLGAVVLVGARALNRALG